MKTLTEFVAVALKTAAKTRAELTSGGKTIEELPAAMGEALKLEGDKLSFMMNAIEVVGNKSEDLKRVIVFTVAEGEKAPPGAKQMGEHYYAVEYYPSLNPKRAKGRGDDRDDRRGGKFGDKRGDKRGGRNERGPGGPSTGDRKTAGDRPRGPRPDRPAREPRPQIIPGVGKVIVAAPVDGITTVSFETQKRPRPAKQPRPQGRSGLELPKPKNSTASAPMNSSPSEAKTSGDETAQTDTSTSS